MTRGQADVSLVGQPGLAGAALGSARLFGDRCHLPALLFQGADDHAEMEGPCTGAWAVLLVLAGLAGRDRGGLAGCPGRPLEWADGAQRRPCGRPTASSPHGRVSPVGPISCCVHSTPGAVPWGPVAPRVPSIGGLASWALACGASPQVVALVDVSCPSSISIWSSGKAHSGTASALKPSRPCSFRGDHLSLHVGRARGCYGGHLPAPTALSGPLPGCSRPGSPDEPALPEMKRADLGGLLGAGVGTPHSVWMPPGILGADSALNG